MKNTADRLERLEYLRGKANITYEEAAALLDRFDDDMTRALIELERSGRINSDATCEPDACPMYNEHDWKRNHHKYHHHHRGVSRLLTFLFKNRLEIYRKGETLVNLPVGFYLLLFIFAPHLFFPLIIVMFLFGCSIRMQKEHGTITQEDVSQFASRAAQNVRNTVQSVKKTIKQEPVTRNDDVASEESEITVE